MSWNRISLICVLIIAIFDLPLIRSDGNLKEICQLLKPRETFNGVQVYHQIRRSDPKNENSNPVGHYLMYQKGKEWQFRVWLSYGDTTHPRIDLVEHTLVSIRSDDQEVLHQFSVYFEYGIKDKDSVKVGRPLDQDNGLLDCDVLKKDKEVAIECCCDSNGELITRLVNRSTQLDSKSVIAFNPTPGRLNQWIGFLDRSNRADIKFFSPYDNSFKTADQCPTDCIIPTFFSQLADNMLQKLDAVVEYGWSQLEQQGWLLFFNIDKKPKFCFTAKERLSDGCKPDNLQEYGFECTGRKLVISGRALDVKRFEDSPDNDKDESGSNWVIIAFFTLMGLCALAAVFFGGVFAGTYYEKNFIEQKRRDKKDRKAKMVPFSKEKNKKGSLHAGKVGNNVYKIKSLKQRNLQMTV